MSEEKKPRKYDLYFPHKAGARNDPKFLRVMIRLGDQDGHIARAIYWDILEVLRESPDFRYPADALDELAMALRISPDKLRQYYTVFVDKKVDLLKEADGHFYSKGLNDNMEHMKEKSVKARESAKKRWDHLKGQAGQGDSKRMRTHNERNANASQSQSDGTPNAVQPLCNERIGYDKYVSNLSYHISYLSKNLQEGQPHAEGLLRAFLAAFPVELTKAGHEEVSKIWFSMTAEDARRVSERLILDLESSGPELKDFRDVITYIQP